MQKVMQFVFSRRSSWSQRVSSSWVRWGGLLASQRFQAQSALSSGSVRIAVSVNLLLVPVSRCATEKTIKQRYAIKFCAKLNKSLADTHQMIQEAYGDSALSHSQVYRWLKLFKNGREEVEDDPRSGRPSTSKSDKNVSCVRDLLNTDRRMSVRMIADTLSIPKTTVHCCARDMGNFLSMLEY
jgi:transposase